MHALDEQPEEGVEAGAVRSDVQLGGELPGGGRIAGRVAEFCDDLVEKLSGGRPGKGERNDPLRLLGEVEQVDEPIG